VHGFRKFGPKSADHPGVGRECPACHVPLTAGCFTTLVLIGPGDDPEARQRCRAGRSFNAVGIEAHWSCVTGLGDDED
jgi:hypothetical protein